MFISPAFAQEAAAQEPSALASFVPLILIMAIFYFLILRPQQKRYKQHQAMQNAIGKGDKVVTGGGIIGKVTKVDDNEGIVFVQIAEGVTVQVARSTISTVVDSKKGVSKEAANDKQSSTSKKKSDQKVANDN